MIEFELHSRHAEICQACGGLQTKGRDIDKFNSLVLNCTSSKSGVNRAS